MTQLNVPQGTIFLSDIDGTCSEHVPVPTDAVIVEAFLNASRQYASDHPGKFIYVTGRDRQDAERMIHPEETSLRLPFLASHGAVFVDEKGDIHTLPYNEAELAFIKLQHKAVIDFFTKIDSHRLCGKTVFDIKENAGMGQLSYEGLNTGSKAENAPLVELKHDGVVVYLKFVEDAEKRADLVKAITMLAGDICDRDDNPGLRDDLKEFQDESGQEKAFGLKVETADQLEIRGPYTKGSALYAHGILDRMDEKQHVTALVDTLGPTGTDRALAKAVRGQGGSVVQVLNDRPQNHPEKDDPVYPDQSYQTPTDLAHSLARWVHS